MTKSRSFTSNRPSSKDKPEPVFFELDGKKFNCLPRRSGAVVINAIAQITGGEGGVASISQVVPFLTTSVVKAERDAFTALINDDEDPIDFEVLLEVMSFLLETYASRPTKASSASEANS